MDMVEKLKARELPLYPKDTVLGYVDDRKSAEQLLNGMINAGFAESDLLALFGDEGLDLLRFEGEHHSRLKHFLRRVQKGLTEGAELKRAEEILEAGGFSVFVKIEGDDEKTRALDVMKEQGAHNMVYLTEFNLTTYD